MSDVGVNNLLEGFNFLQKLSRRSSACDMGDLPSVGRHLKGESDSNHYSFRASLHAVQTGLKTFARMVRKIK
ncbi:hypothetical protein [Algoriphagus sp.]|uniref:hypothetical protein n=1 Tax=Algoriphagus sp. TaxID=1872435 RepID=UPI003268BBCF